MWDDSRVQQAIAKRDSGQLDKAYEELDSMLQLATEAVEKASLLLNMASVRIYARRVDEAGALIQEARKWFPPGDSKLNLYAEFGEALILRTAGRDSEAVSAFQLLLGKYADLLSDPEEESVYVNARQCLGMSLVAVRRFEEGIAVLEELLNKKVGDEQGVHLYLGVAYSFLPAENQRARSLLLKATNGPDPECRTEAFCRLGIMECQANRPDSAIGLLGRAMQESSQSSEWRQVALDYLGRIKSSQRTRAM